MSVRQAPAGLIDRSRRPLRVGHVLVTLEHLAIVTWPIAEAALRTRLPANLRPVVRGGDAFVSAVVFRNRNLRPAILGVPRMMPFQMNLRSYIVDPESDEPGCVFFHGLYLSQRWLATLSARMFRVPFQHLPLTVRARHDRDHVASYEAWSTDGRVSIAARETDRWVDDEETLGFLTNPHTGYVMDRRGVLQRWSIWHRPQTLHSMTVSRAELQPLAGWPLGAPTAFYVPSIDYEVYLPPTAAMKRSLIPT